VPPGGGADDLEDRAIAECGQHIHEEAKFMNADETMLHLEITENSQSILTFRASSVELSRKCGIHCQLAIIWELCFETIIRS
jgi:hypothetical protein